MSALKKVLCGNRNCKKVVGEIAEGTARFRCKYCGTYTTHTVEITPAPPSRKAQKRMHKGLTGKI